MKRRVFSRNVFCFFALVMFLWVTSVFAADLYVNWQLGPYTDIQSAIDDAMDGDVIHVADGTYPGNLLVDKAITIESENGRERTIIDCQMSGRGISFSGGEASGATLSGFTITGGSGERFGGAVLIEDNASVTIADCTFRGNAADYGGAVACIRSSPTVRNVVIENNAAVRGGGVYLVSEASPSFYNCLLVDNSASQYGGAIVCYNRSSPSVVHCTITGNSVSSEDASVGGGALYGYFNSSPNITNSILWGNSAANGAEILLSNYSSLQVSYSDVNRGGDQHRNISLVNSTIDLDDTNIEADPAFVGEGDYHLLPDSPCIDAGMDLGNVVSILSDSQPDPLDTDIEGDPRVFGNAPDMGADEYVEEEPEVIQVEIDIRPGCRKNRIDLRSWGLLPVAVKTTKDFNAKDIDPRTVEIAGAKPVWRMYYDLDRDRDKDMVFFFRIRKLDLDENSKEATLTGRTRDGECFEGTDNVTIIKLKCKAKHWHFCKCR